MDSSDEEVLLGSYCFPLNHHQEQIQIKKEKGVSPGNIFKKNGARSLL